MRVTPSKSHLLFQPAEDAASTRSERCLTLTKSKLKPVGSGASERSAARSPAASRHGLDSRRDVRDGVGRSLPGGAPGPPRRRSTASGSIATRSPTSASAASSRRPDTSRSPRSRRTRADYPGRAPAHAVRRVARLREADGPGRPRQLRQLVDVHARRRLAAPDRPDRARSAGASDHPVVHVAFGDAEAFAALGGQGAADRGGVGVRRARAASMAPSTPGATSSPPRGRHMANTWQGEFPWQNLLDDGYEGTSPVDAFPPERLRPARHDRQRLGVDDRLVPARPRGRRRQGVLHSAATRAAEREAESYDPCQPAIRIPRKVLKGGSHLCAPNYCRRYRPAARFPEPVDTSTCHVGFRCIVRANPGDSETSRR